MGHIVSILGIKPNEENLKSIKKCPRPNNVKQVKSFLGLASYYCRNIKDFSKIAAPFYVKLGVAFKWNKTHGEIFQELKSKLLEESVLLFPDLRKNIFWSLTLVPQVRIATYWQKGSTEVFYKKAVLKNVAIFTGKQLSWSILLVKFATLLKRDSTAMVFLWI